MLRAQLVNYPAAAPTTDAAILEGILAGNLRGPKRGLAIMNAAGGFVVAGLANCNASGIELAREQLDSGRALEKLRALQNYDGKVSA